MSLKENRTFIAAFKNAFNGMYHFFKTERNGQIELVCTFIVIGLAFYCTCNTLEWISILFCIAIVFGAEMFNSALEKVCDLIQPEFNKKIQYIKDVSAAAVLICSIISAIIAAIIFLPKIWIYIHSGIY